MKVSQIYKGNYISVEKWPTEPAIHTITEVGTDTDRFSKEDEAEIIFVKFDGESAQYRVNKTNALEVAKVHGDEIEKWKGKKVALQRIKGIVNGEKTWIGEILPVRK
jgi:uncharacterized OB-fold protein